MSAPVTARAGIEGRKTCILVADDHAGIRQIVSSTLKAHPSFEVCAEAKDGADAIKLAEELKPDVAVLNVVMPVVTGLEAAAEIRILSPKTVIVIISLSADKRLVEEARKIGCRGYVAKTEIGQGLIQAIETAIGSDEFVLVK
jgi:DNA-binding NarL/FixJ family response regulator